MKTLHAVAFGLLILLFPWVASAAIDVYDFTRPEDEQRFRVLLNELRCPKCQNQSIADSDAELARDIKDRVHAQIAAGRSDDEIIAFMVERYGDFVTYRPPVRLDTVVLWFGPFLVVFLALLVLLVRFKSRRKQGSVQLTPAEQARLAELVAKSKQR